MPREGGTKGCDGDSPMHPVSTLAQGSSRCPFWAQQALLALQEQQLLDEHPQPRSWRGLPGGAHRPALHPEVPPMGVYQAVSPPLQAPEPLRVIQHLVSGEGEKATLVGAAGWGMPGSWDRSSHPRDASSVRARANGAAEQVCIWFCGAGALHHWATSLALSCCGLILFLDKIWLSFPGWP